MAKYSRYIDFVFLPISILFYSVFGFFFVIVFVIIIELFSAVVFNDEIGIFLIFLSYCNYYLIIYFSSNLFYFILFLFYFIVLFLNFIFFVGFFCYLIFSPFHFFDYISYDIFFCFITDSINLSVQIFI